MNEDESKDYRGIDPAEDLGMCDSPLHEKLRQIRGTNVQRVRRADILPGAHFYENPLNPPDAVSDRDFRRDWLERALRKTAGDEVIFFDPDNGIASKEKEMESKLSSEHAYVNELRPFVECGKSLVIYHHAAFVSHEMQTMYLALRLQSELGLTNIRALKFGAGGGGIRFYFVVVQPKHKDLIYERLANFRNSRWCTRPKTFTVYSERLFSISLPCKP